MADDWDDMTVDEKLEELRSTVETLAGRMESLLTHMSELINAVEAIELKLRQ